MNILFLTPALPHPNSGDGGSVHVYGLIKFYSRSHRVTVLSFADEKEMRQTGGLDQLPITLHLVPRRKGWQGSMRLNIVLSLIRISQFLRSLIYWQPYYVSKYFDPAMVKRILSITKTSRYDIVQIEYSFMGQYRKYLGGIKAVLRAHDLVVRPAARRTRLAKSFRERLFARIELCRWARYEPALTRSLDHIITVTRQDRDLLMRLSGSCNVSYAPMGVDIPGEVPAYRGRRSHTLLFVGSFAHGPNVDAALWLCADIFPLVLQACPDAVLWIAGRGAPDNLRTIVSRSPAMKLLGFVEDLDALLRDAAIFVAPIRWGGGIKTKIVQAMGFGLPVVTTKVGAEGIEVAENSGIVIGRTAKDLADGIVSLIVDRARAEDCSRLARSLILGHYSWTLTGRLQEDLYQSLLDRGPTG